MNLNENILRVKEVMGLISENENRWFLRRLAEIDKHIDSAFSRADPRDFTYHDYVEEIAWQVADEYENKNNPGIELILDYIRDNYWNKIQDHYLKVNDFE